jgi:GST-like protein
MIDFYAMGSPNVVKVYIALEEMRLSYQVHPIDVFASAQFNSHFRTLNPHAKVPVIVDNDGPNTTPYTVFESGAILIYLAEKTGQFLALNGTERFDTLQWLMMQMTGQGPMSGQFVHFTRFAPPGNEYSLTRYQTQVRTIYQNLDARLAEHQYLNGTGYSIADIAMFPWSRHDIFRSEVNERYANVTRWADEISARPAVARAMDAAADVRSKLTPLDKMETNQLDRFLARGQYAID